MHRRRREEGDQPMSTPVLGITTSSAISIDPTSGEERSFLTGSSPSPRRESLQTPMALPDTSDEFEVPYNHHVNGEKAGAGEAIDPKTTKKAFPAPSSLSSSSSLTLPPPATAAAAAAAAESTVASSTATLMPEGEHEKMPRVGQDESLPSRRSTTAGHYPAVGHSTSAGTTAPPLPARPSRPASAAQSSGTMHATAPPMPVVSGVSVSIDWPKYAWPMFLIAMPAMEKLFHWQLVSPITEQFTIVMVGVYLWAMLKAPWWIHQALRQQLQGTVAPSAFLRLASMLTIGLTVAAPMFGPYLLQRINDLFSSTPAQPIISSSQRQLYIVAGMLLPIFHLIKLLRAEPAMEAAVPLRYSSTPSQHARKMARGRGSPFSGVGGEGEEGEEEIEMGTQERWRQAMQKHAQETRSMLERKLEGLRQRADAVEQQSEKVYTVSETTRKQIDKYARRLREWRDYEDARFRALEKRVQMAEKSRASASASAAAGTSSVTSSPDRNKARLLHHRSPVAARDKAAFGPRPKRQADADDAKGRHLSRNEQLWTVVDRVKQLARLVGFTLFYLVLDLWLFPFRVAGYIIARIAGLIWRGVTLSGRILFAMVTAVYRVFRPLPPLSSSFSSSSSSSLPASSFVNTTASFSPHLSSVLAVPHHPAAFANSPQKVAKQTSRSGLLTVPKTMQAARKLMQRTSSVFVEQPMSDTLADSASSSSSLSSSSSSQRSSSPSTASSSSDDNEGGHNDDRKAKHAARSAAAAATGQRTKGHREQLGERQSLTPGGRSLRKGHPIEPLQGPTSQPSVTKHPKPAFTATKTLAHQPSRVTSALHYPPPSPSLSDEDAHDASSASEAAPSSARQNQRHPPPLLQHQHQHLPRQETPKDKKEKNPKRQTASSKAHPAHPMVLPSPAAAAAATLVVAS